MFVFFLFFFLSSHSPVLLKQFQTDENLIEFPECLTLKCSFRMVLRVVLDVRTSVVVLCLYTKHFFFPQTELKAVQQYAGV